MNFVDIYTEAIFVLISKTGQNTIQLKVMLVPQIGTTVTFFDVVYEVTGVNWHYENGKTILATIYASSEVS
jgi:hypothetical protein